MVSPQDTYASLAQDYAAGVRSLFGLDASGRTGAAAEGLANRATRLAVISRDLGRQAVERLQWPDWTMRAAASTKLLAKALVDFQVSAYLLQAAQEEEGTQPTGATGPLSPVARATLYRRELEDNLRLIQAGDPPVMPALPVLTTSEYRANLSRSVSSTLTAIEQSATRSSQSALSGLLSMGTSKVTPAAQLVSANIAQVIGAAEKVSPLYIAARQFFAAAFNTLATLLGPEITRLASSQIVTWVNEIVKGQKFAKLLQGFYQTASTADELAHAIQHAPTISAEAADSALGSLNTLKDQFQQQIAVIDKMLLFLRFLPSVPPAALPQAQQLMAAAYIILAGYIIYSGADFVDAPNLQNLDRIPGPRRIFERVLGTATAMAKPPAEPEPTAKDARPDLPAGEFMGGTAALIEPPLTHAKPPLHESEPPTAGMAPAPAPMIEEKIRLDLAVPSTTVVVGEPFEIAIAIRLPQSARLALDGLDQVTSGEGTVYREKPGELVRYRVKVSAPACEIETPEVLFLLPPGRDSDPRFFLLTPRKAGPVLIIVTAYQETDLSVAQTRVQLKAVLESVEAAPLSPDEARQKMVDTLELSQDTAASASEGSPAPDNLQIALYSALKSGQFTTDDLKEICFELGVDWDNLDGGERKDSKSRALIIYLARLNQINRLVEWLKAKRPDVSLP